MAKKKKDPSPDMGNVVEGLEAGPAKRKNPTKSPTNTLDDITTADKTKKWTPFTKQKKKNTFE